MATLKNTCGDDDDDDDINTPEIFNANCTTSYVLNSGVTELNLIKFLQGVQKSLLITLLK